MCIRDRYKIETGKAVFDAEHERQKLEKLTGEGTNAFNTKGIQELFQQIMSISRKRQYQDVYKRQLLRKSER